MQQFGCGQQVPLDGPVSQHPTPMGIAMPWVDLVGRNARHHDYCGRLLDPTIQASSEHMAAGTGVRQIQLPRRGLRPQLCPFRPEAGRYVQPAMLRAGSVLQKSVSVLTTPTTGSGERPVDGCEFPGRCSLEKARGAGTSPTLQQLLTVRPPKNNPREYGGVSMAGC